MLDECAPGHTRVRRPHNWVIRYQGQVYPSLPTGQHGKRPDTAPIEVGHIRKMARHLGITECCQRVLQI